MKTLSSDKKASSLCSHNGSLLSPGPRNLESIGTHRLNACCLSTQNNSELATSQAIASLMQSSEAMPEPIVGAYVKSACKRVAESPTKLLVDGNRLFQQSESKPPFYLLRFLTQRTNFWAKSSKHLLVTYQLRCNQTAFLCKQLTCKPKTEENDRWRLKP